MEKIASRKQVMLVKGHAWVIAHPVQGPGLGSSWVKPAQIQICTLRKIRLRMGNLKQSNWSINPSKVFKKERHRQHQADGLLRGRFDSHYPLGPEHRAERQEKMPGHSELVTRANKSLCTYQKAFGYLYIKTVHVDQKKLLLFKNIIIIIFVWLNR